MPKSLTVPVYFVLGCQAIELVAHLAGCGSENGGCMVRAGHALGIALMCVAIAQYGALAPAPPSTGIAYVAPGVLTHPARKAPAKGDAHGCRRLVARPLRPHRVRRHMLEDASTAQEEKDTGGTGTSNDGTRMQTLGGRQRTFRPDGTQAEDTQGGPLEEAQKVVCAAIKSVRLALGLPVDAWDRQERMPEIEQFYAEVEREVGLWVKEVQGVEDERIASIRDALEAVSDQLNRGSSLQWSRQSKGSATQFMPHGRRLPSSLPGELRLTFMCRAHRANSCRPCGHVACNPEANRPFDKESADFYRADPPQVRQRYVPADGQGATVDRGGDRCRRADSYRLPDG